MLTLLDGGPARKKGDRRRQRRRAPDAADDDHTLFLPHHQRYMPQLEYHTEIKTKIVKPQTRVSNLSLPTVDSTLWNEDFTHRPSWCDADAALRKIRNGKAEGNTTALRIRSILQRILFKHGCLIQKHFIQVLVVLGVLMGVCLVGWRNMTIQTDIVKLWVEHGGRLDEELNFLSQVKDATHQLATSSEVSGEPIDPTVTAGETTTDSGLSGGFQVFISTPRRSGLDILTRNDLLLHADVLTNVSMLTVKDSVYGEEWSLQDLCFKPPSPNVEIGPFSTIVQNLLDRIIPCVFITPLDCFWDGAKPLGPFPPITGVGDEFSLFIPSLPKGDITWKNLHPGNIINDVSKVFDLGLIGDLFRRAGLDSAYQERPCVDPLEDGCPATAPNAFDACAAVEHFLRWNATASPPVFLSDFDSALLEPTSDARRRKRQSRATSTEYDDDYYDNLENDTRSVEEENDYFLGNIFGGVLDGFGGEEEAAVDECALYGRAVRRLIRLRPDLAEEFLPTAQWPREPNYGRELTHGCDSFASAILSWPEDLIVGGIERDADFGSITKAEALQSVMLVDSPNSVFVRFKGGHSTKSKLSDNPYKWTPALAADIIAMWQRNFTKLLYEWPNNTAAEWPDERQVHPLASTSISDMLDEFSQFKFFVIFIGYFFMLVYATTSLYSCDGVDSCGSLGFSGVLLVTFASACGLGLSMLVGIDFNAATTQIVPFLSLGLGVDDMFLLVHNYREVVKIAPRGLEIGCLLKETGLSVLLTSINNIIAFGTGNLLPVPALQSFCLQTAILLSFNMIAILTIFPAIMTIDLKRRRAQRLDLFCCVHGGLHICGCCSGGDEESAVATYPAVTNGGASLCDSTRSSSGLAPPNYEELVGSDSYAALEQRAEPSCPKRAWRRMRHVTLQHFVKHVYIPFVQCKLVKAAVVCIAAVMLGLGILGVKRIELGLELTDVIPKGTAPYAFLAAREKYFSFYPMFAVIKGPIDYPAMQETIRAYREEIGHSGYTVKNQGKIGEQYWLSLFTEWLVSLQADYDLAIGSNLFNQTWIDPKAPDPVKMAYKLTCNAGTRLDCTRIGNARLIDGDGHINDAGFYNYLTAWFHTDAMMYYVSQASFYPAPPDWSNDDDVGGFHRNADALRVPPAQPMLYSQIPFFLNGLVDTPATVDAIKKIRATCERFAEEENLPNFPQGIPFTFWEQYLHLTSNLIKGLVVITFAVLLVISVLLWNLHTALIIVGILVMMVVELAGFMGWVGLKLNAVSAVTLITAVGIGVEFTVHVSLSFLTSLGTRDERLARTLDHMFIPVVHGGISTLLGIIMLAFSEFEFIIRYFFLVMTALIVIGLINGLLVLPVVLSLFGPRSEVRTVDGSSALSPPTPPPVKRGQHNELATLNGGGRRDSHGRNGPCAPPLHDSLSTIHESDDSADAPPPLRVEHEFELPDGKTIKSQIVVQDAPTSRHGGVAAQSAATDSTSAPPSTSSASPASTPRSRRSPTPLSD